MRSWILLFALIMLIACADMSRPVETITTPTVPTVALESPTAVALAATSTISITPLVATAVPPSISTPTVTAIPPTPTVTMQPMTEIQAQCGSMSPLGMEEAPILRGLLLLSNHLDESSGLYILGEEGLDNPFIFVSDTEDRPIWPYPSPNKEWMAFYSSNVQDNSWSIEITVWNPVSDEEIKKTFDFEANWFVGDIYWANENQLIIPLKNEGELFRWWIWSPFSDEEMELLVELPGIGNQVELYRNSPLLDPLLEMVVYPCELCDEGEYAVKNIVSGETMWFIDLGPEPSFVHRSTAYWSPNGRFVTVVGGKFLNQLLVFNREGERVHEITLPLLDDPGSLMIFNHSWSPDSNYLAFLRVVGSEGGYERLLTYVDMVNGELVDLCINASTGFPIWSPDSTKIAFSQQVESGQQPRRIFLVDIHSGDVAELYDAKGHNLLGWTFLPNNR